MQNEPERKSVQQVDLDLLEQLVLLEKVVGATRKQLEFAAEMLKTMREELAARNPGAASTLTDGDGRDGSGSDGDPASSGST